MRATHDQIEAMVPRWLRWASAGLSWPVGVRTIDPGSQLHPSVVERFALARVDQVGGSEPYRPEPLRGHREVAHFYGASASSREPGEAEETGRDVTARGLGSREPRYEERLVLFVDFLGFKAAVSRTASGEARLAELFDALNAVGAIGEDNEELSSQKVTQFSDSVVVSYTIDEESAVFRLLNSIAFCVIDLVERDFLLRGAVTRGLLFHDEDHVVGPALVKAYEMESKQAIRPRIVIDPEVLAVAWEARADQHDADDEEGYVRDHLSGDTDGLLWID